MSAIQQLLTDHIDIWTAAETEKRSGRGRASGNAGNVYGIKKLRELILELAVRGRLIQRNGPWKNLKLSDLGSWAIGSGFPSSEQGHQNEEILFVKVSDMNLDGNEKFILSANNTISEGTARRLRINVHLPGTVIFPKIGGAIATNKRRIITRPTAIDNNCLGLTPKNGVSSVWLYLFLSSIDLSKYQAGTSVPALAQGVLKDIPTILPDAAEQELVVAKVDELMALCDQLEAQHSGAADAHEQLVSHLLGTLTQSHSAADFNTNWQRIAAHFDTLFTTEASIDALKQTLLQLAVMGKLVAQDANDESASELLKRIVAEKAKLVAEGKIKKDKPFAPISSNETPFDLPPRWCWVRFGEIGTIKSELVRPEDFQDFRQIAPDCIEKGTGLLTESRTVKEAEIKGPNSRFYSGQIVYSKIRPSLSKAVFVDFDGLCSADMYPIDVFINPKFMLKEILSECFLEQVRVAENRIKMPKLNQESLTAFILPLPPLAEQIRIVKKIDELTTLCDDLRSRITDTNRHQKRLADVLVEHAVVA